MPLVPVESSNIKAVGYDAAAKHLTVQFKSGATHRYEDVPPEKHAAMMDADSIGGYFHAHIKNGDHKSSKIED